MEAYETAGFVAPLQAAFEDGTASSEIFSDQVASAWTVFVLEISSLGAFDQPLFVLIAFDLRAYVPRTSALLESQV